MANTVIRKIRTDMAVPSSAIPGTTHGKAAESALEKAKAYVRSKPWEKYEMGLHSDGGEQYVGNPSRGEKDCSRLYQIARELYNVVNKFVNAQRAFDREIKAYYSKNTNILNSNTRLRLAAEVDSSVKLIERSGNDLSEMIEELGDHIKRISEGGRGPGVFLKPIDRITRQLEGDLDNVYKDVKGLLK